MPGDRSHAFPRLLLWLARWLDRPAGLLGRTAAWLLLPMIAVIAFDVIGRRYIRHLDFVVENDLHHFINSPKLQDSEWHFSAALIVLALGYAFSRNIQIRLDIVRHRFSARRKVWIEFLGTLVLLPFLAVMLYFAGVFVHAAWSSGEQSAVLIGLPHRWLIKAVLLLGLATLAMAALSLTLRCAVWLFGPTALTAQCRLESLTQTPVPTEDQTMTPQSS